MTLSPNTFNSIDPLALSTSLVRISLIALDLAFTSIAQIPSTTGGLGFSRGVARSEYEPVEEGEEERVNIELDRGDLSGRLKRENGRDCLSQYILDVPPATLMGLLHQIWPSFVLDLE